MMMIENQENNMEMMNQRPKSGKRRLSKFGSGINYSESKLNNGTGSMIEDFSLE
jgi:hypothetical protein